MRPASRRRVAHPFALSAKGWGVRAAGGPKCPHFSKNAKDGPPGGWPILAAIFLVLRVPCPSFDWAGIFCRGHLPHNKMRTHSVSPTTWPLGGCHRGHGRFRVETLNLDDRRSIWLPKATKQQNPQESECVRCRLVMSIAGISMVRGLRQNSSKVSPQKAEVSSVICT